MWIPITLVAAVLQVIRTSQQHRIRDVLTINAAGFVRYAYGAPIALTALLITAISSGWALPTPDGWFWLKVTGGGISQILGTLALLRSFELRDFAIGTVFSKTEVVTVGVISTLFLGESIAPLGWIGIALCLTGVAWLAAPTRLGEVAGGFGDPAALMGTLAGAAFAITSVSMRSASTSLDGSTWPRAILTLTAMMCVQTIVNGLYLFVTDRSALTAVVAARRPASIVGLLSVCGSAGWTVAFTLTNAAKVRTLGQAELVIVFAVSVIWLRERHVMGEYVASALVAAGVTTVVLFG